MELTDLTTTQWPRQKLARYGLKRLNNFELIAIILGTGVNGHNVLQLSRQLLRRYTLEELANLSVNDLMDNIGLGISKASAMAVTFEISRRLSNRLINGPVINPSMVWHSLIDFAHKKKEYLIAIYLDSAQQVIKKEIITKGIVNASLVHPRELFEPALRCLASKVIIVHNHPSGQLQPSSRDLELTQQIVLAGQILGIEVIDHIIITSTGYISLKEGGWIFNTQPNDSYLL